MNYEERLAKPEEVLGKAENRLEVADVWDVSEAVDMLVGMRPIVGDPDTDPDRIKRDMRELAYGSIDAKTLPCVGKPKQRRVRPADFIRWATSKGLPIPQRMEALVGVEPPPGTAAAPASAPEPIKARPGAPIKIPDEAIDIEPLSPGHPDINSKAIMLVIARESELRKEGIKPKRMPLCREVVSVEFPDYHDQEGKAKSISTGVRALIRNLKRKASQQASEP